MEKSELSVFQRTEKLFTPGPVNIPMRVYFASALGSYHHRTKEFSAILNETLEMLKPLFGTNEQVMPVHTTGRGALEGIYKNLFTQDDRVVCVVNGKFGEMAAETLKSLGIAVKECFDDWASDVDIKELETIVKEFKATGLVSVYNDTSNGVINSVSDMGLLAQKYNLMFVVDCVSSIGCMPFEMDKWGVDAVATASQKGLMSPAGLSFVALSPKAMVTAKKNKAKNFYINFPDIYKNVVSKAETPGSTPVSLVLSVSEALKMIYEEKLENVLVRHKAISLGTKAALQALGFSLFPKVCAERSDSLTVATMPKNLSAKQLAKKMSSDFRLKIGVGLGAAMADSNVRIAHMGYCYVEDMLECLSAMECVLTDMGLDGCIGKGVKAFYETYKKVLN